MNNRGLTPKELIIEKVKKLNELTKWSDEQLEEYRKLYNSFLNSNKKKKKTEDVHKDKGDKLEDLVNFIFNNSFFLSVYPNKRTSVNEIDQFVVISDYGLQAIHEFNYNIELLGLNENHLICECKNYHDKIPATWVGKFNTLLNVSGSTQLGIIFSYHGLTGQENNWYDAHGLTKIIYKMSNEGEKSFILDFNKSDFEKLLDINVNIFDIIKAKKISLISNISSHKLLEENEEASKQIKEIYNEIIKR